MAPKGDIAIAAKSVEIKAAEQASKTTTEDKYKQSGLTVAVTGPAISAKEASTKLIASYDAAIVHARKQLAELD